jgi:hypothetical protein
VHVPEAGARAIQTVGAAPDEPAAAADDDRLDSAAEDTSVGDHGRKPQQRGAEDKGRDSDAPRSVPLPPIEAAPTLPPPLEEAPQPPAPVPTSPTWRGAKALVQHQLTQGWAAATAHAHLQRNRQHQRAASLLHGSNEAEEVAAEPDATPHPGLTPTQLGGTQRQSVARALSAASGKLGRMAGRACAGAPSRVQAACARARDFAGGNWNAAAALEKAQRRVKAAAGAFALVMCFFLS